MNSKLLRLSLVLASALIMVPRTAQAISFTFDVDASSGIGTGFFSIDLPNNWPGNIGQTTLISATGISGLLESGDPWTSLSVALSEPLAPNPDSALLFGASKKVPLFTVTTAGVGITPADAVDNIPGVSLRVIGVPDGGVTAAYIAASFLGLLFLRRRLDRAA